ncbi:MAG: hypothetical protein AABX39_05350 [Nanoarchaeota archaeon]
MSNWKPDEKFLEFLLSDVGSKIGNDLSLFGVPDGTTKGGQGYNMKDLVEEMRAGKEWTQDIYEGFQQTFKKEFKAYQKK